MIEKCEGFKYKYRLTETSTNEEFQKLVEEHSPFKQIVCNRNTKNSFLSGTVTINNKLKNGEFFINYTY